MFAPKLEGHQSKVRADYLEGVLLEYSHWYIVPSCRFISTYLLAARKFEKCLSIISLSRSEGASPHLLTMNHCWLGSFVLLQASKRRLKATIIQAMPPAWHAALCPTTTHSQPAEVHCQQESDHTFLSLQNDGQWNCPVPNFLVANQWVNMKLQDASTMYRSMEEGWYVCLSRHQSPFSNLHRFWGYKMELLAAENQQS